MTAAKTFADLKPHSRRRGCYVCGAPTVAKLSVQLFSLSESKQSTSKLVTSWTRNMCESCSVRAYNATSDAIDKEVGS